MKGSNFKIKWQVLSICLLSLLTALGFAYAEEGESFGNLFGNSANKAKNTAAVVKPPTIKPSATHTSTKASTLPSLKTTTKNIPIKKSISQNQNIAGIKSIKSLKLPPKSSPKKTYPKKSYRAALSRKLARPNELNRAELSQLPQVAVYMSAVPVKQFEENLKYLLSLKEQRAISLETVVIYDMEKAQAIVQPEYIKDLNKSFPNLQKLKDEVKTNSKSSPKIASQKLEKLADKYIPKEEEYFNKAKEWPLANTLDRFKKAGFKANKKQTIALHKKEEKGPLPRLVFRENKKARAQNLTKQANFKKIIDTNGNLISKQLGSIARKEKKEKKNLFQKSVSLKKKKQKPKKNMGIVFSFKHYEDDLPFWLR